MPRNRFARSLAVSMVVAAFAVLAIPLTHCSTNSTPTTDTGVRANALAGTAESAGCSPRPSPTDPVICIASDGTATPDTLRMNNNDHGVGNPIIWRADGGRRLSINVNCPQVETPSCNGPICIGRTTPAADGPCTYTATIDGTTGTDPIIVTDQCCPAPGTERPGKKH